MVHADKPIDEQQTDPLSGYSIGRRELIILLAMMSALDAFSIDAMLPALGSIGHDLGLSQANHRQFIITSIFLGFSFGVLVYGFVSDSLGRRGPIICGFVVYLVGALVCAFSSSFGWLIAGRVLQGLGAAGPYVLAIAVVRDLFVGREMARLMSLVMMVFMAVPMIAPLVGQGLLLITGWRGIFIALMLFALLTCFWVLARLPETLPPAKRLKLNPGRLGQALAEVVAHPQSRFYMLATGAVSGPFIAYLSTVQQVFQDIYGVGRLLPLIFASIAVVFAVASFCNEKWVQTVGMRRLAGYALCGVTIISLLFMLIFSWQQQAPSMVMFMLYMAVIMFCFALLFGNMTALALEPMGHIAGTASSVVSSISTAIALPLAIAIGSQLQGSVYPIVMGFGVTCGVLLVFNYRGFFRADS